MLHQFLEWGPGPSSPGSSVESFDNEQPTGERPGFWIFEVGTHRALSSEPVVPWIGCSEGWVLRTYPQGNEKQHGTQQRGKGKNNFQTYLGGGIC